METEDGQATNGEDKSGGNLGDLARQRFGSLFHEPPPGDASTPVDGSSGESPTDDAGAIATSDATEAEPTEDASAEEGAEGAAAEAVEGDDAPDTESESEGSFRSLSELFAAADIDMDSARSLPVRVKVDGQESEVPLAEVLDSYQMSTAADKRLAEAKEKAKALDQELSAKREAAEAHLAETAKLVEQAEGLLQQETEQIDWKRLREDDPAEYSAKKQEISERRAEIDRMKQEAVSSYQKAVSEQRQEAEKNHQERLAQEQAALLEQIPEWRDTAKAQADKERLAKYLVSQGFSQQDVQGAADHRLVLLARKAMLYDQSRESAGQKRVRKPGRVIRPGTPPAPEQQNREREKRALEEHRKRGTRESALNALRAKRGSHGSADRNVLNQ